MKIQYRWSKLLMNTGSCVLFILTAIGLVAYGISAISGSWLLGIPSIYLGVTVLLFISRLSIHYFKRLFHSNRTLLAYDDNGLYGAGRFVPWSSILRVQEQGTQIGRWFSLESTSWIFYLKDGSEWKVTTDELLSPQEWKQARSVVRNGVHERGWKSIRKRV
ncbi:hypothetical protein Q5741_12115 [Paenibacillus sp. JX-17]|uniref:PH domain-containing protein n=1 Tax=Paenibacillus lacisoli TaxID=3064525 RepID=A0ABT9CD12_9BACL|nr:hypothetical protein [Paenibacillus sp. JX-17]MDO7907154.1 hypothetical protein [Paenibacillus sp. JX-17]